MQEFSDVLVPFVSNVCKNLVGNPKNVKVNLKISTKTINIFIDVDKSDRGRIIGKQGRTIGALNIICNSIKNNNFPSDTRQVSLLVDEEND